MKKNILTEKCMDFIDHVFPNAPQEQKEDIIMVFFAGAISSFDLVTEISDQNEKDAIKDIDAMHSEIMSVLEKHRIKPRDKH